MAWALVISFIIGAICGVRVPVLIFTFIIILVIAVFVATGLGLGYPTFQVFYWSVLLAAVLEAGYAVTHGLLYLIYVKGMSRREKRAGIAMKSKYSSD